MTDYGVAMLTITGYWMLIFIGIGLLGWLYIKLTDCIKSKRDKNKES